MEAKKIKDFLKETYKKSYKDMPKLEVITHKDIENFPHLIEVDEEKIKEKKENYQSNIFIEVEDDFNEKRIYVNPRVLSLIRTSHLNENQFGEKYFEQVNRTKEYLKEVSVDKERIKHMIVYFEKGEIENDKHKRR